MRAVPVAMAVVGALLLMGEALAQPPPAQSRVACHRFDELARQLQQKYGEAPVSLGIQSNGNLLQVFASAKQGTWTILSTAPSGLSCIIAAGRGWEALAAPSGDPEA
jgi:hypothetical protein